MLIFLSFLVNLGMLNPKMADTKNNFNALTLKFAKSKMAANTGVDISKSVKSFPKQLHCVSLIMRIQKKYTLTYLRCMVLKLYPKNVKDHYQLSRVQALSCLWESEISKLSDLAQNSLKMFVLKNHVHEVIVCNVSRVMLLWLQVSVNFVLQVSMVKWRDDLIILDTIGAIDLRHYKLLLC